MLTGAFIPSWSVVSTAAESSRSDDGLVEDVGVLLSTDGAHDILWHPGLRCHHLFENRIDALGSRAAQKTTALSYPDKKVSFADLEAMSNRIGRYLTGQGAKRGDRIGLLFDRSAHSFATVLTVSKIGAVFVPLDASFPPERIKFILNDAQVNFVATVSVFAHVFDGFEQPVLALDAAREVIDKLSSKRLAPIPDKTPDDELSYIIYTSGSTGTPKGVPIRHSSICNFLNVACRDYGYSGNDRVYQALTIAFDYSFEEIWVPLLVGACLVPAPSGVNLVGEDLAEYLIQNEVTALCCVPTLLATVTSDLPSLRMLIVSGEACPQDLVERWWAPGRRFLNLYGPTEATVSATWTVLSQTGKVTIGGPLATYSVLILDCDDTKVLAQGEVGEICIAGVGLADGYLNLPEETARVFIDDVADIPNNPSGKIYRTGDMGWINNSCEIEYLGRIDTQVKIRGYRIELDEIEAVARDVAGIESLVVNPFEVEPGNVELVAYYTVSANGASQDPAAIQDALSRRLPDYMVPAFYEVLTEIPMLPSGKVARKELPAPRQTRLLSSGKAFVGPEPGLESDLAGLLASLLKVERVSSDADFFDDLGANSLLMARYLASVRKKLGAKGLSVKQIYQNPTIASLAASLQPEPDTENTLVEKTVEKASLEPSGFNGVEDQGLADKMKSYRPPEPQVPMDAVIRSKANGVPTSGDVPTWQKHQPDGTPNTDRHVATYREYVTCGLLQIAYYLCMTFITILAAVAALTWIESATTVLGIYIRAASSSVLIFVAMSALLVAVKWIAVGRFDTQRIPVWSLRYVRFWIAQSAVRTNPLNVFVGTPVYNWYLSLLGAKIGSGTLIFARTAVCTDLISIGDDTLIRQFCVFTGYTAHAGYIYPGRVSVGSRAYVGEATVLGNNTRVGDDAQLGNTSTLLENQSVPDGAKFHGSPAEETQTNYMRVKPLDVSPWRARFYVAGEMLSMFLVAGPAPIIIVYMFISLALPELLGGTSANNALTQTLNLFGYSLAVYLGAIIIALAGVMSLPRLFNLFFVPGQTHPLFGVQYFLARSITSSSNSLMLQLLFGDSSMIVHYFRALGYDLSESTQTGSNFGVEQRHDSPFLVKFGRNTLVSDGLVLHNMDHSTTSFRLSPIEMPPDTYLGNDVHYAAGAKVGNNCLIATKCMIPIDGPVHEGVGILGSPPFEIPRSVMRDRRFDHYKQPDVLNNRLKLKLRSNLWTLALFMFRSWSAFFVVLVCAYFAHEALIGSGASSLFATSAMLTGTVVISVVFTVLYFILFERCIRLFRPMNPLTCSLYDRAFWDHERFWKLTDNRLITMFDGTPMKNFFVSLQGVRLGKMVFDNGGNASEPRMVEIGDYCTLNYRSFVQGHSLEDGTFKSGAICVGAWSTIGVNGFVHYSVSIGDNAVVEADSFVMKGSVIGNNEIWRGNPAKVVSERDLDKIAADDGAELQAGRYEHSPVERAAAGTDPHRESSVQV